MGLLSPGRQVLGGLACLRGRFPGGCCWACRPWSPCACRPCLPPRPHIRRGSRTPRNPRNPCSGPGTGQIRVIRRAAVRTERLCMRRLPARRRSGGRTRTSGLVRACSRLFLRIVRGRARQCQSPVARNLACVFARTRGRRPTTGRAFLRMGWRRRRIPPSCIRSSGPPRESANRPTKSCRRTTFASKPCPGR